MKKKLFLLLIPIGLLSFLAMADAQDDPTSPEPSYCARADANNWGRCYGAPGSETCESSINPFKTCVGTISFPTSGPGGPDPLP